MNIIFYGGLFALGALDALQPGHAKSLISSYLVGANARVQQLLLLGLVVILTHIVINGLLAVGILSFASTVMDNTYLRTINISAGAAMVLLALYLVWQRFFLKLKAVAVLSITISLIHRHYNKKCPFGRWLPWA